MKSKLKLVEIEVMYAHTLFARVHTSSSNEVIWSNYFAKVILFVFMNTVMMMNLHVN